MTSKSLSTGTLSLRFMQNAHRAKQLKEVELDRAEVKDDGMWEVSQAVRDAWGLQRDIEDSSSVPFSFCNLRSGLFYFILSFPTDLMMFMSRHTYHSYFRR